MSKNIYIGILLTATVAAAILLLMAQQKIAHISKEVVELRNRYVQLQNEAEQDRELHVDLYKDCARDNKELQERLKICR